MSSDEFSVYKGKGFEIVGELTNGTLQLSGRGVLSPIAKKIASIMNEHFGHERPMRTEDGRVIFSGWIPPIPSRPFNRMFQNQIRIAMTGRHVPEQVSVAVTGRCPCDCVFCCAKGINAKPELTLGELESLLHQQFTLRSGNKSPRIDIKIEPIELALLQDISRGLMAKALLD